MFGSEKSDRKEKYVQRSEEGSDRGNEVPVREAAKTVYWGGVRVARILGLF